LLLQTGGMISCYQVQQYTWHRHMRSVLNDPATKFGILTLSVDDYNKCKQDKDELCIEGKMFDIKSVHITGDKVIVYAVQDDKEDNINGKIRKTLHGNRGDSNIPQPLIELLSLYYILPAQNSLHFTTQPEEQYTHAFCDNIFSRNGDILIPPPRA